MISQTHKCDFFTDFLTLLNMTHMTLYNLTSAFLKPPSLSVYLISNLKKSCKQLLYVAYFAKLLSLYELCLNLLLYSLFSIWMNHVHTQGSLWTKSLLSALVNWEINWFHLKSKPLSLQTCSKLWKNDLTIISFHNAMKISLYLKNLF